MVNKSASDAAHVALYKWNNSYSYNLNVNNDEASKMIARYYKHKISKSPTSTSL